MAQRRSTERNGLKQLLCEVFLKTTNKQTNQYLLTPYSASTPNKGLSPPKSSLVNQIIYSAYLQNYGQGVIYSNMGNPK